MIKTSLVNARLLDQDKCKYEVLKDFIDSLDNHPLRYQLINHFSDLYLYIINPQTDVSRFALSHAQLKVFRNHGQVIAGFMLLHNNKSNFYNYIEQNSFIIVLEAPSDFAKIDIITKYEKTCDAPIQYTLPFVVNKGDEAIFWKNYISETYKIDTRNDFKQFMDDRNIIEEGGDWENLINLVGPSDEIVENQTRDIYDVAIKEYQLVESSISLRRWLLSFCVRRIPILRELF